MSYSQLDRKEQFHCHFVSKYPHFQSRKCIWKCHLQDVDPLSRRQCVNTLRPRQDGGHFPDDIFKCISLNENAWTSIKISLKFVPKDQIHNIPALVQIMAWRQLGDKPLSEPMMVKLPTHICVTRPQWVNTDILHTYQESHLVPVKPPSVCGPRLLHSAGSRTVRGQWDMASKWLRCRLCDWLRTPHVQCIMAARDQEDVSIVFKCHWQSPSTALTAGNACRWDCARRPWRGPNGRADTPKHTAVSAPSITNTETNPMFGYLFCWQSQRFLEGTFCSIVLLPVGKGPHFPVQIHAGNCWSKDATLLTGRLQMLRHKQGHVFLKLHSEIYVTQTIVHKCESYQHNYAPSYCVGLRFRKNFL